MNSAQISFMLEFLCTCNAVAPDPGLMDLCKMSMLSFDFCKKGIQAFNAVDTKHI